MEVEKLATVLHQRQVQQRVHHSEEHVVMEQHREVMDIQVVRSITDHVVYVELQ